MSETIVNSEKGDVPQPQEDRERPSVRFQSPADPKEHPHQNGTSGLCTECQSLDLGVHSFKVQASPKLPGKSRSYTTAQQLGSLQSIRKRSSECEMCALIVDSVEEASVWNAVGQSFNEAITMKLKQEQATCSITWEIDGRETSSTRSGRTSKNPRNTVRGLTRRLHVRWDNPHLSDAYLVYVAPDRFARTASDADRVWAKDSLFLGRKVTRGIENQALIRSWLDLCQKSHRGPCRQRNRDRTARFVEMVSHSFFGVIDVQDMQLTQLPCKNPDTDKYEPYVALSYVWGSDEKSYTTLTQNVMLHRTHGGLEKVLLDLPKVIRDAIDLVRRIGYRYMWIDRLCIVQNSARSWKLNAYNMDLIYGNAALTICAADGDASVGLRAMRTETRNTKQYKRKVKPDLELMVTRPPEIYIRASEWNERAWTFQERLLSRRCLIFANGRVYFQCRSTGMSEDIFGDQKGAGWSLDLVDAPMQMFRQLENRSFWVYMKCVELYTERKLTQAKDIQAAFSGMANLMRERMNAPFVHGLPSSHFDLALLWQPSSSVKRRLNMDPSSGNDIPDFPSWSWTGWVGNTTYQTDLLGGILDNVSQWLDTRTWIQWWVRDGHGDLRPLWSADFSEEDLSEDQNWRGYTWKRGEKCGPPPELRNRRGRERTSSPYVSSDYRSSSAGGSDSDSYSRGSSRQRVREYGYDIDVRRSRREVPERYPRREVAEIIREEEYVRPERPRYVTGDMGPITRDVSPPPPPLPPRSEPREPVFRQARRGNKAYDRDYKAEAWPIRNPHPQHNAAFFDMFFNDDEKEFNITLRDYPYRVVKAAFDPDAETSEFPLLPILQFHTWHTWLHIKPIAPPAQHPDEVHSPVASGAGTGLVRCHIADETGDWCGSVVLDAEWAGKADERQEFIAISEAKSFTLAECPEWTYYVPKEREQSEWDLFYVLLVQRKDERWERVGVGKVFKEAFHNAKNREIMLS